MWSITRKKNILRKKRIAQLLSDVTDISALALEKTWHLDEVPFLSFPFLSVPFLSFIHEKDYTTPYDLRLEALFLVIFSLSCDLWCRVYWLNNSTPSSAYFWSLGDWKTFLRDLFGHNWDLSKKASFAYSESVEENLIASPMKCFSSTNVIQV
mgnify:FL=1